MNCIDRLPTSPVYPKSTPRSFLKRGEFLRFSVESQTEADAKTQSCGGRSANAEPHVADGFAAETLF
jgi:hypothetical protein